MKKILYRFGRNFVEVFSGWNLAWHLLAITLTYLIVTTGIDWSYFLTTRYDDNFFKYIFPALAIGGLLPIVLPLILFAVGYIRKNATITTTASAIAQSAILGSVISSTYKAFTGRIQPSMIDTMFDISRNFQFGFLKHGIFWGWPSSHTTIAFSTMVTLIILYPKNIFIRVIAVLYAFYVGLGVSVSIHWFSDFVAGAIIGTVIGIVVAKSFKGLLEQKV